MSINNFLEIARGDIVSPTISTLQKQETIFKLIQLVNDVKTPVKLLICFKSSIDGQTYFALENIKGCPVAPSSNRVQTKTTYQDDETISTFLQVNDDITCSIRYAEKSYPMLGIIEVVEEQLTLPAYLNLYWVSFNDVQTKLQISDRENFQAMLLKV